MVINASPKIQKYFEEIETKVQEEFKVGKEAKAKGFDPSTKVDIQLAKNLAERVVGLISIIAPQVVGTDIVPRIVELEKEYGSLDWRVSMIIAHEVAQEKFCTFKDKKEAIEVGIRVGFAYSTVGVVSSPLEGFTDLNIKKRLDGKGEYFCLNFAGPIRNAGGTNASVCVLIADYVRRKLGYAEYDANEKECERCYTELIDYHSRITNLQYVPSKEEMLFMVKNMPVEISGMSSEKIEVSNYKDLPRVPTNLIRSGYCLMYSGCLPLKAPKLWKKLSKWGKEFEMDQWNFLEEFLEIQHHAKSQAGGSAKEEHHETKEEKKEPLPLDFEELIKEPNPTDPIYTYITDLVAGRPVISHPLASGGLRLRYGRSRTSGYSAQSLHPATLVVLDSFFTTATQMKVERPGKAAAITTCDTIMGPVVLLNDGAVVEITSEKQALSLQKEIKEVLYVGDVLINYGDYFDRAAKLNKPGYCEEWWALELEKEIRDYLNEPEKPLKEILSKIADLVKIEENVLFDIITKPLTQKPSFKISKKLSSFFDKLALHPLYTFFFTQISFDEFFDFLKYVKLFKLEVDDDTKQVKKMLLPYGNEYHSKKRIFEKLGIPHFIANNEFLLIESNPAQGLLEQCILYDKEEFEKLFNYVSDRKQKQDELVKDGRLDKPLGGFAVLHAINLFSKINIKDKAGTFVGARMGRPEKAKMRKMQTSPHGLFPVGEEGGRMRSFQDALEKGTVETEFEYWWDEEAGEPSAFPVNFRTGNICVKKFWDNKEKKNVEKLDPEKRWIKESKIMKYPFKEHFDWCLKKLGTKVYPDLIKGVLGVGSTSKSPENPMKAILRAKHELFVNKDGTVRYDGSEVPITHFKPKEVGTSIPKLKELGYTHDIHNQPLTDENQVLQLFPQDLVLPSCDESPYEPADEVFFRTTKYIDDELEYLYGLPRYYNLKKKEDLAGQYIVLLAPHTSAGSIARIVGSSKTQGLFCHPLMHAAIRRDCDGDEGGFFLLLDAFINFSTKYLTNKLGGTMDAPLVLTSILNPSEVDDMVFNMEQSDKYPLEFYQAAMDGKMPWDVKFPLVDHVLGKPEQYDGYKFTHDTDNLNSEIKCSVYKTLPSMKEKLDGQMALCSKLRCVDESDVARIVIEKHFIKDTRGNLRKFSQQVFRCTKCGEKYRRPPLSGKCKECGFRNIIFTVTEGSIKKYVEYSIQLARDYHLPPYLQESLELTRDHIDSLFGKETEKQEGLGKFFG